MSRDPYDNKHTVRTAYSQKTYWKDGYACSYDEDPKRVDLSGGQRGWPEVSFELPRQKYDFEKVERLMLDAYERGKTDARVELGKHLRELISL